MGERRQTESERKVIAAISAQLNDNEFILEHVRFSDVQAGDVECDVLVFCPGFGIAAIEIKGGVVQYVNGEWIVETSRGSRRSNPVEQARKAKHALRRFLSRQESWSLGLVRSEWLVAMPFTEVASDMGTEGRRDLLIGAADLSTFMDRVRAALDSAFHSEARPTLEDLENAKNLILSAGNRPDTITLRTSTFSLKHGAAYLGITAGLSLAAFGVSEVVSNGNPFFTAGFTMPVGALASVYLARSPERKRHRVIAGIGASLLATGISASVVSAADAEKVSSCSPNYSPCVPIVKDLDCKQIAGQVHVIGQDVYRLDRDGDGLGCEWNEPSPSASA